ncbi:MAG: NAD(P)H-dependent oxidoreductase [Candidatus Micrarchaeia archaeon]
MYVPIILGSTREGRMSVHVAKLVYERMKARGDVEVELIDLKEYALPIMSERLAFLKKPPGNVVKMGEKLRDADAIMVITPEYNKGYPGVLKNALDYFYEEYKGKAFGIVTVSAGEGGPSVLQQLRLIALGLGAVPVPPALMFKNVGSIFDENGKLLAGEYLKKTDAFINSFLEYAEALMRFKK